MLGVTFQAGDPYPDPNNPTLLVRDVSAYTEPPSSAPVSAWPFVGFTPPVLADFTWVNQGAATVAVSNGILTFTDFKNSGDAVRYLKSNVAVSPTTPYTVIIAMVASPGLMLNLSQGGFACGIALSDGTKYTIYGVTHGTNDNPLAFGVGQYATASSVPSWGGRNYFAFPPVLWLKLQTDGAIKRVLSTSLDPTNAGWQPVYSESNTNFLSETSVGIAFDLPNPYMGTGATGNSDSFVSWAQSSP